MSADLLRRAAALATSRAREALAYQTKPSGIFEHDLWHPDSLADMLSDGTLTGTFGDSELRTSTELMTLWSPTLAFALADWLDATADAGFTQPGRLAPAIRVARLILGEPS